MLISAPGKDADCTVVFGVNHMDLTAEDVIVSNAFCTTNCLAPLAKVLDDAFGIRTGYMTTVHSFTGDQPSHDAPHKDLYRAQAASISMVPTSTGAARAISRVLRHLAGRLEGSAVRVPTPNVSLVDLSFVPDRPATREAVNAAVWDAARGDLAGILSYEEDPLVSVDFNHDNHSSCLAAAQTSVTEGGLVRVVSWYDNEWGFSNRMIDTSRHIGALPQIAFCPTGGISPANARSYLDLPNVLCAGGSWVAPKDRVWAADWAAIEAFALEARSLSSDFA